VNEVKMFRTFSKLLVTPLSKRTFAASGAVRSFTPLRVSIFSSKPYDKKHLDEANQGLGHTFDYHDEHLSSRTAVMANGSQAVCTFVNDHVSMVQCFNGSFFFLPYSSSSLFLCFSPLSPPFSSSFILSIPLIFSCFFVSVSLTLSL